MTWRNDETIICAECGRPFHWSYRQQRHFRDIKKEQPKHCPECIEIRRGRLRSSEIDHPSSTLYPQGNPLLKKPDTPKIGKPAIPPSSKVRPSRETNPQYINNVVLALLVFLFVITLVILLFVVF
ncbi:MAG: zinc-ribbon domain containing protein [Anaerolineales bacterium]|nr:zinc-ribbon domain containing protein [Anaerolineales bacterium]